MFVHGGEKWSKLRKQKAEPIEPTFTVFYQPKIDEADNYYYNISRHSVNKKGVIFTWKGYIKEPIWSAINFIFRLFYIVA